MQAGEHPEPVEPETPSVADRFRGVGVALVTPMGPDGAVDEEALHHHAAFQCEAGSDVLVPCGTTGESATLAPAEHQRVVEVTVDASAGRRPIMAGAGGNDTARVLELAHASVEAGADALLSVSPAYNKPTPAGLLAHYSAIAEAVDVPVVLYNVPGRTASNVPPEVVLELAHIDNVIGVKEASGDLEQVMTLIDGRPEDFPVLSGDDSLTLPMLSVGADGVISVVANQAPRMFSDMVHAALDGAWEDARALHYRLLPLMRANFLETNPILVKAGLALMGRVRENYRLPLVGPRDETRAAVAEALREAGLLR